MFKQLMYKWFGLSDTPCNTCEVLRELLVKSEHERSELLNRLLAKDKVEPPSAQIEEFQPIKPQITPWRVRQQMMEAEDRKAAQLIKQNAQEIDALEKELGVSHAVQK